MSSIKFILLSATLFCIPATLFAKTPSKLSSIDYFIENRGQIRDQDGHVRTDIQYELQSAGINVFIGDGQLHYEFLKRETCNNEDPGGSFGGKNGQTSEVETYRLDVGLIGANTQAQVIPSEEQSYFENYYIAGCPESGILAHTFKRVTYKNVYPDIDWVIYLKSGKLEHEFIIGPAGDASRIKFSYNGQTSLDINNDGSITAATPLGIIKEHAPVCYAAGSNQTAIAGAYRLRGNVLSYDINNYEGALVIDPMVEWGTYYGPASSTSPAYDVICDKGAGVYIAGLTWSDVLIVTTGAFQSTYGGNSDGYLVKFDTAGNRLWGTYYGGDQQDWATGVSLDTFGNVYLSGITGSTTSIATTGSYQPVYGGGQWDGFFAKFSPLGIRQWCTYYGGSGGDMPYGISSDMMGHIYLAGFTTSSNQIATSGGFRPTPDGGYDVFLAQFNYSGTLQWGTYYGGPGNEFQGVCAASWPYVYLAAWTGSSTGISTLGSYQPAFGGGGSDAFVVKFDYLGNRQWATYIGGEQAEGTGGITCDGEGNIYLLGSTGSSTGIASTGCFQPAYAGGGTDAFLMKLSPETGYRIWGTYFGGEGEENVTNSRLVTGDSENVYITGYTVSLTGIASPGAIQDSFSGGDYDCFLAKFNMAGNRAWSTYYGGTGDDIGMACAFDGQNLYMSGESNSTSKIATPGGFEPTGGGGAYYYEGFLVKISERDTATVSLAATSLARNVAKFNIYPSPNNGSFLLSGHLSTGGAVHIIITDATGKIVGEDDATAINGVLDKQMSLGNNLPSGEYFLRIVSAENVYVLKFAKE